jgi:hypothetical protein
MISNGDTHSASNLDSPGFGIAIALTNQREKPVASPGFLQEPTLPHTFLLNGGTGLVGSESQPGSVPSLLSETLQEPDQESHHPAGVACANYCKFTVSRSRRPLRDVCPETALRARNCKQIWRESVFFDFQAIRVVPQIPKVDQSIPLAQAALPEETKAG